MLIFAPNHFIMEKIDSLDKKILDIVTRNARIPSKNVAIECGVSRAAIHQRIQRLIELKVIIGSGYDIDPKTLGFQTCTYIGIRLERGSMYRGVVKYLEAIPEIVECHFTTGPYTMLCKLYARDNEHLMELLNTRIQGIDGVFRPRLSYLLRKASSARYQYVEAHLLMLHRSPLPTMIGIDKKYTLTAYAVSVLLFLVQCHSLSPAGS